MAHDAGCSSGGRDPTGVPADAAVFRDFADRLSGGEDAAAAELLARYSGRLVALASRRLDRRLRAKLDPEDMVQSALRTFFRRLGSGEVELRDWSSLSGFLCLLTIRKCQRQAERFAAAARDVRWENPLDCDEAGALVIPDRDPTPDEVVAFADLVESLLSGLDGRDRAMTEMLLAGEPVEEVARALGCSRRTVYRTTAWVRQTLTSSAE